MTYEIPAPDAPDTRPTPRPAQHPDLVRLVCSQGQSVYDLAAAVWGPTAAVSVACAPPEGRRLVGFVATTHTGPWHPVSK